MPRDEAGAADDMRFALKVKEMLFLLSQPRAEAHPVITDDSEGRVERAFAFLSLYGSCNACVSL